MTAYVLQHTVHRPWPLPDRPWVLAQRWLDLLFAHWPLPPETVRPLVPPALPLDTFDGQAWIGVVPFRVAGLRPRALPAVPWISYFPELNVRTYVTVDGKPGVYFFSLDAASRAAVAGARALFGLPYHHAEMDVRRKGEWILYRSRRRDERDGRAEFRARYRPAGGIFHPAPGTLEHWLTERYCLYTAAPGPRIRRVEVHHPPWALQPAEAEIDVNTMVEVLGVSLPPTPPLLHFARRQDVLTWAPQTVRQAVPID